MIRASALSIARYCGAAPRLAARLNVGGRAAAMSSAFHAKAADQPGWRGLYENLTEDERAEVDGWVTPTPFKVWGAELRYEMAQKEVQCGLDRLGRSVDYGSEKAITQGTADMLWIVDTGDEGRLVVIGDIKKSRFTTSDGPRSLQLLSYALSFADLLQATAIMCAIWVSEDKAWHLGEEIDLAGEEAANAWRAVKSAALAEDAYNTGAHCRDCYSRLQCPAHLLPVTSESALAPFSQPGGLTHANAAQAVYVVQAMEDALDKAKDSLKAFAQQNGGIHDKASGKVWKPTMSRGKPSLNREALEKDHPGILEKYTRPGAPYPVFKWMKAS